MRLLLIVGMIALMNTAQAKVAEVKPTVEAPSVQAELMNELDETPEDLDFDSDDQLMLNTVDEESLVIDAEIEKIALDEKTEAPKIEAKATTKPTTVKKK